MIANTPRAPYYAVIFTSIRTIGDSGYGAMANLMEEMAKQQPGFLGIESVRDGLGLTISYWTSEEAILSWKKQVQHVTAQNTGRKKWYENYKVRICKVERDYEFQR
jgi:heme-degrading monooxygenase HmoA